MIRPSNAIFMTQLSGLGNPQTDTFSVSIPAQNLAAFRGLIYTAELPLTRTNSIHEVQVRFTGRDTDWYYVDGYIFFVDPSSNFYITVRSYIQSGTLYVQAFLVNQTGGVIAVPAFTVDCRASIYDAPF